MYEVVCKMVDGGIIKMYDHLPQYLISAHDDGLLGSVSTIFDLQNNMEP